MLEFETVTEMLEYRDGEVYWKHRPLKYFAGEQWYTSWNKKYAGTRAGALRLDDWSGESYRWIKVFGKSYPEASIVWLLCKGQYPECIIDHEDHNPLNNKIENLNPTTYSNNSKNRRLNKNTKSGIMGVRWIEEYLTWRATIKVDSVTRSLGCNKSLFEAACLRKAAELKYDFHSNHGLPA